MGIGRTNSHGSANSPLLPVEGLKEVLNTNAMVGMIFFEVAGGPYGAEPVVRKGGAMFAILGFLLIPLIWSLPIAVMTAELCSHDPHVGGKIHFVHKCWGPWVGWMNGWFNAVSNVFDVATLPAMAMGYLEVLLGVTLSEEMRWWGCFSALAIVVVTNIAGVEVVGKISYVLCLLVCSPPLILVLLGMGHVGSIPATNWQQLHWLHFLTSLMWNTSGFDDAGASAAEIEGPREVFPKALGISVALVTALYILPIAVGVAVEPNTELWHDGFLAKIGAELGGVALGLAMSIAGFVSSLAQLNALLCTSVREVICLAEQEGQPVPAVLGRLHPTFRTPHVGTVAFAIVMLGTLKYQFVELIAATVIFDCVSFLIQFATWIHFRWHTEPDGAFRAPLNVAGVALWSTGPIFLCCLVLFLTLSAGGDALYGTILVYISGEVLYRGYQLRR